MPVKNKYHKEIIGLIKKFSVVESPDREGFGLKYVGTNKPSYHLNTKDTQTVAKEFLRKNKLSTQELHLLLDSLYYGGTYEEVNIAAKIIQYDKELRQNINFDKLNYWLENVHGWAEVDTLCQMAFTSDDILSKWGDWKKFLVKLNRNSNVHKRRASLVFLTKPVGQSADIRLSGLAFNNVNHLKQEKDILITKAVSWILRTLIKNHRSEVISYLEDNSDKLPKIAVREVKSKLETGKKYISKSKQK